MLMSSPVDFEGQHHDNLGGPKKKNDMVVEYPHVGHARTAPTPTDIPRRYKLNKNRPIDAQDND
jgi:hypothetical protein